MAFVKYLGFASISVIAMYFSSENIYRHGIVGSVILYGLSVVVGVVFSFIIYYVNKHRKILAQTLLGIYIFSAVSFFVYHEFKHKLKQNPQASFKPEQQVSKADSSFSKSNKKSNDAVKNKKATEKVVENDAIENTPGSSEVVTNYGNLLIVKPEPKKLELISILERYGNIKDLHRLDNGQILIAAKRKNDPDSIPVILLNKDLTENNEFSENLKKDSIADYLLQYNLELKPKYTLIDKVFTNPNGEIYLSGVFSTTRKLQNGMSHPIVSTIRLRPNGEIDRDYNPEKLFGYFLQIIPVSDGFIFLKNNNDIIKVNFNLDVDQEFVKKIGEINNDGNIHQVLMQPDGKLVFSGLFNQYSGNKSGGIVRIDPDGNIDQTFIKNTENHFFSGGCYERVCEITGMVLQPDGKIVISTNEDFTSTKGVIRLNSDGTFDQAFNDNLEKIKSGGLHAYGLFLQDNGKIISRNIAYPVRINADGTADKVFNRSVYSQYQKNNISIGVKPKLLSFNDDWFIVGNDYILSRRGEIIKPVR